MGIIGTGRKYSRVTIFFRGCLTLASVGSQWCYTGIVRYRCGTFPVANVLRKKVKINRYWRQS